MLDISKLQVAKRLPVAFPLMLRFLARKRCDDEQARPRRACDLTKYGTVAASVFAAANQNQRSSFSGGRVGTFDLVYRCTSARFH